MIHLYTICWNEIDMLGFFFRHYDAWVDRYVIYDNGSTDGSLELLGWHPKVEVRRFERAHPDSFVLSHQALHNEAWKESRANADWVIVTALDEHLHVGGRTVLDYLVECKELGITAVPALGYQMLSERYPAPGDWLCATCMWGAPWSAMDKLSIFNPDAIVETGFTVGRHSADVRGNVRLPDRDELMLLHYKYLDFDRTLHRHRALGRAIGDHDISQGWGFHYGWSAERLREDWERFMTQAIDVAAPGFQPSRAHESAPWWRVGKNDEGLECDGEKPPVTNRE